MIPEQMRALADEYEGVYMGDRYGFETPIPAALHSAADRLDAVHAILNRYAITDADNPGMESADPEDVWRLFRDLRATLITDTAHQERHDES